MRPDVLSAIADGEWEMVEGDTATCVGEDADGVPTWLVWHHGGGHLTIVRELGWYKQRGDATWEDAEDVSRAMDAACEAMNDYLHVAHLRRHGVIRDASHDFVVKT